MRRFLLFVFCLLFFGTFAFARAFPERLPPASEAALLLSYEDALGARLASIENAQESIRIQSYIFSGDEQGSVIAEILKKKRAEGKTVQVSVDVTSTLYAQNQALYLDLQRHGIEVQGYEPSIDHLARELQTGSVLDANSRFHEKMWVVDSGRPNGIAIVGGRNLLNAYFGLTPTADHWVLDTDVILKGLAVNDTAAAFDRNWAYFRQKRLNATPEAQASWISRNFSRWLVPSPATFPMNPSILAAIDKIRSRASIASFQFTPATVQIIQSNPRFDEKEIAETYYRLIRTSKSMVIANGLFLPRARLLEELKAALRRGAKIRIVTNSLERTLFRDLVLAGRFFYLDLLDTVEEPGSRSQGASLEILEWTGPGLIHAKAAVFDGSTTILGSYNLDPRSENFNGEIVAKIQSEGISRQMVDHLQSNLFEKSRLVTRQMAQLYRDPRSQADRAMLARALLLSPLQ